MQKRIEKNSGKGLTKAFSHDIIDSESEGNTMKYEFGVASLTHFSGAGPEYMHKERFADYLDLYLRD